MSAVDILLFIVLVVIPVAWAILSIFALGYHYGYDAAEKEKQERRK